MAMRSALSRTNSSKNTNATTSPTARPRKTSSFLSLRKERERAPDSLGHSRSEGPSTSTTPPSSFIDTQFPPPTRPGKSKRRDSTSKPAAVQTPSSKVAHGRQHSMTSPNEHVYAFPSLDSTEDLTTHTSVYPNSGNYLRTRSRTNPSSKSRWEGPSNIPPLRISGSSSIYPSEPRTPDDLGASNDFFEFPGLVAAPVAGVETMDALVDGMNGSSDALGGSGGRSSTRLQFGLSTHPLYQPPLPTPPEGVVLGAPKTRRERRIRKPSTSSESSDDGSRHSSPAASMRPRRRRHRPQTGSNSTVPKTMATPPSPTPTPPRSRPVSPEPSIRSIPTPSSSSVSVALPMGTERTRRSTSTAPSEYRKSVIPSIADIIRTHAPAEARARSQFRSSSMYTPSQSHATVVEEPEPQTAKDDTEFVSRSSMDSVADEVQQTLRTHIAAKPPPAPPSAFMKRHSTFSDNISLYSPRSDPGVVAPSIYSSSAASIYQSHSPIEPSFLSILKPSASQEVAQYLRSARLTTLLKLTRQPHASQDNPLTVSLSDLGSPTGFPVIVFLGLGCVRHIMGLYDEMAECLGWGLGRTDSRPKSSRGIIQWASAVEEVLDQLKIKECSIMAHSAGAPYALSFANKVPSRVRGDICLLAPWVGGGESSGYKWLKYVPNGILKTAQAAEWKIQAWMIGKPPTIAYEGIGYTAPNKDTSNKDPPPKENPPPRKSPLPSKAKSYASLQQSINGETRSRPSNGSSFSEYDDLRDFEGRFGSHSTLGQDMRASNEAGHDGARGNIRGMGKRKVSKGFLNRLKGAGPAKSEEKEKTTPSGSKKLKGLRSMSSLKSKSSTIRRAESALSPQIPPTLRIEVGLGLDENSWSKTIDLDGGSDKFLSSATPSPSEPVEGPYLRSSGHRSISFSSSSHPLSMPSSPAPSAITTNYTPNIQPQNYQAALGNALIAASHAESSKGAHDDLMQILNHDNQPWGFSYAAYPHHVRVWYGDKDEKIAENAVRWMERTMGADRCAVRVVKGADHGLMYRSSVVVDVLECLADVWREKQEPFAGLRQS